MWLIQNFCIYCIYGENTSRSAVFVTKFKPDSTKIVEKVSNNTVTTPQSSISLNIWLSIFFQLEVDMNEILRRKSELLGLPGPSIT